MLLPIDLHPIETASTQIQKKGNPQLVYTIAEPRIENDRLFFMSPLLLAGNSVFTTVTIDVQNFQRTTENIEAFDDSDNNFDFIVPLQFKRKFTKTVNIKSISKFIPKIIID